MKYKNLEGKITKLLESSVLLSARALSRTKIANESEVGHGQVALPAEVKASLAESLNKAKEAFSLDRTLHRFRDQHGENIFHNFDLTYAVSKPSSLVYIYSRFYFTLFCLKTSSKFLRKPSPPPNKFI